MKTPSLLFASLLCFSVANGQDGNILNGGFENWSSRVLYEIPDSTITSNHQDYRGTPSLLKSNDAQNGTYSAEIRAIAIGNDTSFGFIAYGTIGEDGPSGGIPYSASFTEIRFQYKANIISPVDSVFLVLFRYTGGVSTYSVLAPVIGETRSNWTAASFTVTNMPQEALFIGFVIGNPFNDDASPNPGAWCRIDNLQLFNGGTEATKLPNNSFENWSSVSVENPDNWYTSNDWFAGRGMETAKKTSDAKTGNYAIALETVDLGGGDNFQGFISLGAITFGNSQYPFNAVPYRNRPQTFSGRYKFESSAPDSAFIHIIFKKNGMDIGGHYQILVEQSTYTNFSSSITLSQEPDSIIFVVRSGELIGSVLKLDDLVFSGGDVSVKTITVLENGVYPNPANKQLSFLINADCQFRVVDLLGKELMRGAGKEGHNAIDISLLNSGAYLIQIQSGNHAETHAFIKE